MWPTVYAIAAPTPTGANVITIFVNLNIVAERLSANDKIGRFCSSFSSPSAMANRTLNTTICSTCPSATDLAMFSGKTWRMISPAVGFGGALSV